MTASDAKTTNSSTRHVIEAMMIIAQSPEPVGLSEIAEAMDLPQSTAHRALMTLEESGFAKRAGRSAKLVAGDVVHHLIRSMVGLFPARVVLAPAMRQLSEALDVTVSLNWRIGWHSLRLSSFEGSRESYQIRRVGEARPLHSGIGPSTILAAQGQGACEAYVQWWARTQHSGDIEIPDRESLLALARQVTQDGHIRRNPSDYSALVWFSYPLRDHAGRVQASVSVGVAPNGAADGRPGEDVDEGLARQIDAKVGEMGAQLVAAGEEAASPFDAIPPDEVHMEQVKVLRLLSADD